MYIGIMDYRAVAFHGRARSGALFKRGNLLWAPGFNGRVFLMSKAWNGSAGHSTVRIMLLVINQHCRAIPFLSLASFFRSCSALE
jgi:hypothetical protein